MKIILLGLSVLSFVLNGCNDEDNPVQEGPGINSIEEQINSIRPIESILVYNYNGNGGASYHSSSNINDAFASKGFLIVILSSSDYYYNLNRVIEIKVRENEITLRY